MSILDRALRLGEGKQFRQYEKRVAAINQWEPELELLDDDELRAHADSLRERARNGESLDALLSETFAVVRETSRRSLGMRHFDVQLIGGMVLHDGSIAEMKTGEGKTLTGTLAVALNALAGKGVHVVTVNDYLARRDAAWMFPLYNALGLSVGVLQNMQPYQEKRAAYAADITYGTNSEFGFDYLRDNMATSLEEKTQHGGRIDEDGKPIGMHHFAIVDEVDNILIDEARTPLIISGAPEQAAEYYVRFAQLAKRMTAGKRPDGMDPRTKKEFVADFDYEFEEKHKTVSVTEQGVAKAEKFLGISHLYRAENGPLVNHLQQALVGGTPPGGGGEGGRARPGGEPDARDDHAAELLPPLREARRDDGHGADRGDRVHEDLQAARRRGPDESGHGPQRPQRSGLQDQGGQVACGRRGGHGPPRGRAAGPRRDDLGRGLRAAVRRAAQA